MQAMTKNVPFCLCFFNCRRYILDWRKFVPLFIISCLTSWFQNPTSFSFLTSDITVSAAYIVCVLEPVALVWQFIDSFLLGMLHEVRAWMILKSACVNVIVIVRAVCELCRFVEVVSLLLSDCRACVLWTRILFMHSTNRRSFVHYYCDHDCADDPQLS